MHGNASKIVIACGLAALLAGCGSSDSDTGVVPTPTVITPTPVPSTAPTSTSTTSGKGGKGHRGHGHGSKATPAGTTGPVATAPVQTVEPKVTTSPNLVKVKVVVTAGAVTLSPSTLPAGKGMLFNIVGKGVGTKGYLTFRSGGDVVGISRVIPHVVRMETKSLVKGQLEIQVTHTKRIHVASKNVPVG